jgi:hypothetical protein
MILSHFTFDKNLQSILKNGIVPGSRYDQMTEGCEVAWLTSATEPNWVPPYYTGPAHDCRIELVIPSNDRRLVRWEKWARRHAPDILDILVHCKCGFDHRPQIRSSWCFFGVVPTSMIRAVERPSRRRPHERR